LKGYNMLHSHNNGNTKTQHWSGVFYIDTPPCTAGHNDCGVFEYFDTRGEMSPMEYNRIVPPVPGKLVFFPAYLKHLVRPYAGKEKRISISFNLDVQSAFASNRPTVHCLNCHWGETPSSHIEGFGEIRSMSRHGARFRQKFTLEDAIGSHACSLEANTRVTNGIPLGSSLLLPVDIVNCVETLKANCLPST
jgi:hypothetical protein